MGVENGPQFCQCIYPNPRAANGERRACPGIAHPCRDLARQTRPDLDVEDLTPGTPLPSVNANALPVQRMPRIPHHNKLRSVC
jgi:hypothetical protein